MVKKFLAISPTGAEFMFSKRLLIGVPANSAGKIAEALNKSGYKLKPGEAWGVHDNDFYYNDLITAQIKQYGPRMKVYRY